jgi:hypothetical protein
VRDANPKGSHYGHRYRTKESQGAMVCNLPQPLAKAQVLAKLLDRLGLINVHPEDGKGFLYRSVSNLAALWPVTAVH